MHAALGVEAGRVWTCALCVPRPALLLQQLTHQALNRLLHLNQRIAVTYIEQHKKLLLFKFLCKNCGENMWLFQLHCKEDPFYVFPEMKLCGLIPNLEMRPRGFISVNICLEFSEQCLCSVGAGSYLFLDSMYESRCKHSIHIQIH
jgi:hypothetical protein